MTEFLWIVLGLVVGGIVGFLIPRNQKRLVAPTDEAVSLRGQLGRVHTDLENARLETARALQARDALETQVKELSVRLPKLEGFERANADLRLQLQGFEAVRQRLETAQAELQTARPKVTAADTMAASLEETQAELSALKTRTAGFEGLQLKAATVTELEGRVTDLEANKSKLIKEAGEAALKASDAEAAQRKIRLALDEAVAEVARTRDGMRQFETLKARIDDLEGRGLSPETQARLDGLERDLSAAQSKSAALESDAGAKLELQQTQLRVLDLERQIATVPVLKDELHQRNAELTAARDRVAQLDTSLSRVKELEAALAEREAELERLRVPAQGATSSQG